MIYYPPVRKTVIDYLVTKTELTGVEVGPRVPATRPPKFVVISTVPANGPQRRVLSVRRIIAEGWAQSDYDAAVLTETVCSLIVDIKYQGLGIRKVDVIGSPAEFPHPKITTHFRWQLTADLLVRAIITA